LRFIALKVSIITAVFNGVHTVEDCIASVKNQINVDKEHIVIDGGSLDGTVNVIKKLETNLTSWVSEPDNGIYEAMNKGIALATGDIVGILNADDFYVNNLVLARITEEFQKKSVEALFADLVYVRPDNLNRIVRLYSGANFSLNKLNYGWMPPHPTFFVKREVYEKFGVFKTDYKIAADYELVTRFLAKHKIQFSYLPEVIVKMRIGGVSTSSFKNTWILNMEILRACEENGIKTNIFKIFSKYFVKSFQLIKRPGELENW
jgi:glycosyltransferase involved in cell wall biosynthesis